MATEWRETTLDRLGRIVTGKTPPSERAGQFGGSIPFVTPTDFDGRRRIEATARYLTQAGMDSVPSARIPAGAVMISCIGSDMGKAAIAGRECATNQQINSVVVDTGDDPLFIYYNLSRRKSEIRAAAAGSAQPILNKSAFGRLEIALPPPATQHMVVGILGSLDDKIELNRRMNATLEATAGTIFKSWFVDFDPVRAKAEGRQPAGMDADTAALFPASFKESELGAIPTGWSVETVGGIADTNRESLNPQEFPEELFALLSIPAFDDGRVPAVVAGSSIHSNKLLVPPGSVLVSKLNPRIPRVWRPGSLSNRGIASTEFVTLTPRSECPRDVLFAIVSSRPFCERLAELATGTSGSHQRARAEDLIQVPFAFPPRSVATSFSRLASPLFDRIEANLSESQILTTLRDALLPKLLSGTVRRSVGCQ